MFGLVSLLHVFIGSCLAGVAIVAALVSGYASFWILIGGAILGYIIAIPVSVVIARVLTKD